ncbi:hypothetical protein LguiA_000957 [Lonicera macranthoides]
MCRRRWHWSTFRWPELDFSAVSSIFRWPEFDFSLASSIFRWPGINISYLTTGWTSQSFEWFDLSIVDSVMWTVVTAVESLALVTICFDLWSRFVDKDEFSDGLAGVVGQRNSEIDEDLGKLK